MSWITAACERMLVASARRGSAPSARHFGGARSMSTSGAGRPPPSSTTSLAEEEETPHLETDPAAGSSVSAAAELKELREAVKALSFARPEANESLSPEMRAKLAREFDEFLNEFVHSVDPAQHTAETIAEQVSGVDVSAFTRMANSGGAASSVSGSSSGSSSGSADGNLSGRAKFPALVQTEHDQPYSEAEMYVRQLFHAGRVRGLGAEITGSVYRPHEETLHRPRSIAETGVSQLVAAGAHLGHATSRVRANTRPYIYGVREGIHIIDLQQTLAALRRVARVVEELARKGGLLLFVGTRDGQRRIVEKAAERAHGYYVHDRWVPGTFTNYQTLTDQKSRVPRAEVNMADEPTARQLSPSLHDTIIKPDLAIVLNPVENRAMLQECIKLRIPTAGIVDTDSEPSLLTYAVPGNDDSVRFVGLVAGVLSRAAERGRAVRVAEFRRLQEAKRALHPHTGRDIPAPNSAPAQERPLSDVSDTEKQLL